jgi:hypothetical protein
MSQSVSESRLWNPAIPLCDQAAEIGVIFREEALRLRFTFVRNKLSVILKPAPAPMHHSHRIRVVEAANPDWYRHLYHQYAREDRWKKEETGRYHKTLRSRVSRTGILHAIDRIVEECDSSHFSHHLVRDVLFERSVYGYGHADVDIQSSDAPHLRLIWQFRDSIQWDLLHGDVADIARRASASAVLPPDSIDDFLLSEIPFDVPVCEDAERESYEEELAEAF